MTRRCRPAAALAALGLIAALAAATAAWTAPLRTARVGDRMDALIAGLTPLPRGPVRACRGGGPSLTYIDYVVPGRPAGDESASFVGFAEGDRLVILVAYDEDNLGTPVTVYADLDGRGLVTNVWPAEAAPSPCGIVRQFHDRPAPPARAPAPASPTRG